MPRALTAVLRDMRALGLDLELEPDPLDSLGEDDYVPTELCEDVAAAANENANSVRVPISERPTVPAPASRESGVRLKIKSTELAFVTIDAVVCDLRNDPRFER